MRLRNRGKRPSPDNIVASEPRSSAKLGFGSPVSLFDAEILDALPALKVSIQDETSVGRTNPAASSLLAHTDAVYCLELVHCNEALYSGGADHLIRGWSYDGRLQTCWRGHTGCVYSLAWTGDHLASGSADKTVRLWAVHTGQTTRVLTGRGTVLSLCAVDALLFSGGSGSAVQVWSLKTGEKTNQLFGHNGSVKCLLSFPLRGTVLSAGTDGLVKEWTCEGQLASQLEAHRTSVTTCAVAEDLLFTGGGESNFKIWRVADHYASHDRATFSLLHTITHHSAGVCSISWMRDDTGLRIFISGWGGTLRMFEGPSTQLESSHDHDQSAPSVLLLKSKTGYLCSVCKPNLGVFVGGYDGSVSFVPFVRGGRRS